MAPHIVDGTGEGRSLADLHRELRAVADVSDIDRGDVFDVAEHFATVRELEKAVRPEPDGDPRRLSENGRQLG